MANPNTQLTTTPTQLASLYLKQNNLPDTPQNESVLAAWFVEESGRGISFIPPSSQNALGYYNPLGISGTGDLGSVSNGSGGTWASYSSYQAGASAWGSLVKNYYPEIWSSLQQNNSAAAEAAITNSRWVTGSANSNNYGGTIGSIASNILATMTPSTVPSSFDANNPPASVPRPANTLSAWLNLDPSLPLTQSIIADFAPLAATQTGENVGDIESYYTDYIGQGYTLGTIPAPAQSFNKTTYAGATRSPSVTDALSTGISALLGDIAPFVALLFGGILMLGGVYLIYKDTSSSGSSTNTVIQKTVPIVYRGTE
jgi:hypothetical protein